MLEEENSLPCPELHSRVDDRDHFTRPRQYHSDVRGHVVVAFVVVLKIGRPFRHEVIKKLFEITPRIGCGIFHDDQTATGMAYENRRRPVFDLALSNYPLDVAANFVSALTLRLHFEVCGMNAHAGNETDCSEYANQLLRHSQILLGIPEMRPYLKCLILGRCYKISNESYMTRRPFLNDWMKLPCKFPKSTAIENSPSSRS